jgi:hypothetical protein
LRTSSAGPTTAKCHDNNNEQLEPISKLSEQDAQGCKLHEAEEIARVVLPANQEPTLPLNPCKEALDDPPPLVAAQAPSVLGLALGAVGFVRSDHLGALLAQLCVQRIAVVRAISDQILGPRLDHVEVEGELHQRDFVVIRRMRGDRQRQSVTIHDRHDFHAFSATS